MALAVEFVKRNTDSDSKLDLLLPLKTRPLAHFLSMSPYALDAVAKIVDETNCFPNFSDLVQSCQMIFSVCRQHPDIRHRFQFVSFDVDLDCSDPRLVDAVFETISWIMKEDLPFELPLGLVGYSALIECHAKSVQRVSLSNTQIDTLKHLPMSESSSLSTKYLKSCAFWIAATLDPFYIQTLKYVYPNCFQILVHFYRLYPPALQAICHCVESFVRQFISFSYFNEGILHAFVRYDFERHVHMAFDATGFLRPFLRLDPQKLCPRQIELSILKSVYEFSANHPSDPMSLNLVGHPFFL